MAGSWGYASLRSTILLDSSNRETMPYLGSSVTSLAGMVLSAVSASKAGEKSGLTAIAGRNLDEL